LTRGVGRAQDGGVVYGSVSGTLAKPKRLGRPVSFEETDLMRILTTAAARGEYLSLGELLQRLIASGVRRPSETRVKRMLRSLDERGLVVVCENPHQDVSGHVRRGAPWYSYQANLDAVSSTLGAAQAVLADEDAQGVVVPAVDVSGSYSEDWEQFP
jgi:hypothetical protein